MSLESFGNQEERWEERVLRIEAEEKILDEVAEYRTRLIQKDPDFYLAERAFAERIRLAFDFEYDQYQMWHFLVHSTLDRKSQPKFDFPGELSVANFIRQAYAQTFKEETAEGREIA